MQEEKSRGKDELADATRDKWHAYDPTLISEGLFAAANIFSSLKVLILLDLLILIAHIISNISNPPSIIEWE